MSDAKQVTLLSVGRPLTGIFQCEVSADAPLFQTQIMAAPMTVAGKNMKTKKLNVLEVPLFMKTVSDFLYVVLINKSIKS